MMTLTLRKAPGVGWLAVAVLMLMATDVSAQPVGPGNRPAFSPYLNLTRPGVSPAVNYFGQVRPQMDFASSLQGLQSQANTLNPLMTASNANDPTAIGTGHVFGFQNYQYYFQNQFMIGRNTMGGMGMGTGAYRSGGLGSGYSAMGMSTGTGFGSSGVGTGPMRAPPQFNPYPNVPRR